MSYTMIAVNIIAALLVLFVLWWFFGTQQVKSADTAVTILVKDGIYQPALIQVPANKPVILHFLREDDGACSANVVFPQLKVSYQLPKNQTITVELPPQSKGTLDFTCQMGMYRGKIVIE